MKKQLPSKKRNGAITNAEKTTFRKKELEAAKIAKEKNNTKVSLRINDTTEILIDPKILKKKGKEYFIKKYTNILDIKTRYLSKTFVDPNNKD